MKALWIQLSQDEVRALLDYFTKLKELQLPEEARLVVEEIRKLLF